ncbi:hypothetical protein FISHEDRAFT_55141 [Fistulina hepatica ATCC 64428]|uniref:Uncharacterized protein n=1 Tax=Fistulina hepatica ATCC 64428 TaxID=1128425 RepID=A0A0D7AP14_9AGAR|nr:hypothetical protein FISHEDRAFT_55141 [Fistulina hepatica ATCC 64428]
MNSSIEPLIHLPRGPVLTYIILGVTVVGALGISWFYTIYIGMLVITAVISFCLLPSSPTFLVAIWVYPLLAAIIMGFSSAKALVTQPLLLILLLMVGAFTFPTWVFFWGRDPESPWALAQAMQVIFGSAAGYSLVFLSVLAVFVPRSRWGRLGTLLNQLTIAWGICAEFCKSPVAHLCPRPHEDSLPSKCFSPQDTPDLPPPYERDEIV